jgi:peptidoglycan/xylan/chitin deacetylase (PgdA/CDA1 family)
MKEKIAKGFYFSGISWVLFFISRIWYGPHHIRVVNYHSTPEVFMPSFEKQLAFYQKYYSNTSAKDLKSLLNDKTWNKQKPGIILSFDDGLKNNKDFALPLIEKYGFTAWFCIPPGFTKDNQQLLIDENSTLKMYGINTIAKESITMTDVEIQEVSIKHEIVCHTQSHIRLPKSVSDDQILHTELIESKNDLEKIINREIEGFCWVGGEIENYSLKAHQIIKKNYQYSFQTNNFPVTRKTDSYFIDRNNIEVWISFPLFLLTLSGFYDYVYRKKRKKVKQLLSK